MLHGVTPKDLRIHGPEDLQLLRETEIQLWYMSTVQFKVQWSDVCPMVQGKVHIHSLVPRLVLCTRVVASSIVDANWQAWEHVTCMPVYILKWKPEARGQRCLLRLCKADLIAYLIQWHSCEFGLLDQHRLILIVVDRSCVSVSNNS